MSAGIRPEHVFLSTVPEMLQERQKPDGRFASEDGPEFDAHATYEALRALNMAGLWQPPCSGCARSSAWPVDTS
jgi:hypothetical protein